MSKLGGKVRRGTAWLLVGSAGNRVLQFGFGIALARLLVPADFGMMVTIAALTGFAGMFVSAGMGQSLIRAKEVESVDFSTVFTMQIALGAAFYCAFFVTAPWFARFFDNPVYTDLIRVAAITFLVRPFAAVRTSKASREMDFRKLSIVNFGTSAVTGAISVTLAVAGLGVWSLVLSGLAGGLIRNVALAVMVPIRLTLTLRRSVVRKHASFGSKITVNDFVLYLSREGKNILLSKLVGPAFLGLLNKAESLAKVPNDVMMPATMQPTFRAMSTVQDDKMHSRSLYLRAITLLTIYIGPCYVILWWVAPQFIGAVYGEKWVAAAEPMQVIVCAGFFFNVLYPSGRLLDAQGWLMQKLAINVVRLAFLLGAILFATRWGLVGVAWAIVVTEVLTTVAFHHLAAKAVELRHRELGEALLPGGCLCAVVCVVLAAVDLLLGEMEASAPFAYLAMMMFVGALASVASFVSLPIAELRSEAGRWRQQLSAS